MNQQINLYQPKFRRQEKVFSAMIMIQICCLFFVVLAIIYFYGQYQIKPMKIQLQKVNRDVASLRSKVNAYKAKIPNLSKSRLLENEVARTQKELQQREKVRAMLKQQELGNAIGFSGYLEALAREHVQGTWLTGVAIKNGGKELSLQGKTLSSELVPRYIQRLSKEDLLSGITFNVMELQRPKETEKPSGPGQTALDFNISTN